MIAVAVVAVAAVVVDITAAAVVAVAVVVVDIMNHQPGTNNQQLKS